MPKYHRRRSSAARWLGPAHRTDCHCAGDHCGQADAAKSARTRKPSLRLLIDDKRSHDTARELGLARRTTARLTGWQEPKEPPAA